MKVTYTVILFGNMEYDVLGSTGYLVIYIGYVGFSKKNYKNTWLGSEKDQSFG